VGFDTYLALNWGVRARRELLAQATRRAMRTVLADARAATAAAAALRR